MACTTWSQSLDLNQVCKSSHSWFSVPLQTLGSCYQRKVQWDGPFDFHLPSPPEPSKQRFKLQNSANVLSSNVTLHHLFATWSLPSSLEASSYPSDISISQDSPPSSRVLALSPGSQHHHGLPDEGCFLFFFLHKWLWQWLNSDIFVECRTSLQDPRRVYKDKAFVNFNNLIHHRRKTRVWTKEGRREGKKKGSKQASKQTDRQMNRELKL